LIWQVPFAERKSILAQ